jgi:hypothetical protein
MGATERQVRKRRVFHIPGYDPIHPRRYRELYRKESAAQAEISGYRISIRPAKSDESFRWMVGAEIDGKAVASQIDVLVWSDIVRDSMAQSIPATYLQLFRTAWVYIASGTLRRLMWMRKGPLIAALYPVVFLLGQLLIAVVAGWQVGGLLDALLQGVFGYLGIGDSAAVLWLIFLLRWAVFTAVAVVIIRWFKFIDYKVFAYYLMHDYAFSAQFGGANPPALEVRMAEFGDLIAAALTEDVDEVLVVGHSSGAHLAVSILSDLIRAGRAPETGPALAFLSLGQVVPMVSFLPKAKRLRADLAYLAASDALTWIDVTAPGDGCCFALCDPVAVTGVAPKDKRWPLVISAAFTQSLTPARWKALRWRFFRLHFQYLCAFDQPKDYDYFQITAGPSLLRDRYAGRAPSRSRIDVPVSKYTSVA